MGLAFGLMAALAGVRALGWGLWWTSVLMQVRIAMSVGSAVPVREPRTRSKLMRTSVLVSMPPP